MAKRFNVSEAYPGFCTLCHTEIAEFDGFIKFGNAMRPKVIRLKSNFRQALIELSDSSYMQVTLCDECIDFKPEDCAKIYESEYRGWAKEINDVEWTPADKVKVDEWHKKQKSLQIVDRHDKVWTDSDKNKISKHKLGEK